MTGRWPVASLVASALIALVAGCGGKPAEEGAEKVVAKKLGVELKPTAPKPAALPTVPPGSRFPKVRPVLPRVRPVLTKVRSVPKARAPRFVRSADVDFLKLMARRGRAEREAVCLAVQYNLRPGGPARTPSGMASFLAENGAARFNRDISNRATLNDTLELTHGDLLSLDDVVCDVVNN
jgi:hypothetical protein